jgi:Fe2+ or Zn2+ uptake regulation protein
MWKIDTGQSGMLAVMKPYQYRTITMIIERKRGVKTSDVHSQLEFEGIKISRASVINYMAKLAEEGVISFVEESGKGGFHRVYSAKLSLDEIITRITEETLEAIESAFR